MAEAKWLDGYAGQTVDELLALAPEYRIDSLVLAFEQAIQARVAPDDLSALNEAEITVLAVESIEREVNNGGYHQFFLNTPYYAPHAAAALRRIGCPVTAELTSRAASLIGLAPGFGAAQVEAALAADPDGALVEKLSAECDGPYYDSGEPIADRLFDYIRANRGAIRLR